MSSKNPKQSFTCARNTSARIQMDHLRFVFNHIFDEVCYFPPPSSSSSSSSSLCWLKLGGFGLGSSLLGLAKWVPRGETQWGLTITARPSPSVCTAGIVHHQHLSWSSKFSLQCVGIASSFRSVASDVFGPAVEHTQLNWPCFTQIGPRYTHTHSLVETTQASSSEEVSGECQGLFPFESQTGHWYLQCFVYGFHGSHGHTKIHCNCHVMACSQVELA